MTLVKRRFSFVCLLACLFFLLYNLRPGILNSQFILEQFSFSLEDERLRSPDSQVRQAAKRLEIS